jgi:hypothetical protein
MKSFVYFEKDLGEPLCRLGWERATPGNHAEHHEPTLPDIIVAPWRTCRP